MARAPLHTIAAVARALAAHHGNLAATATHLQIQRSALHSRIARHPELGRALALARQSPPPTPCPTCGGTGIQTTKGA